MLFKIRDFIQREHVVSTQQLSREFHLDEQALQPMLDIWVRKGVIKPCQKPVGMDCQGGCRQHCNINVPIFYGLVPLPFQG